MDKLDINSNLFVKLYNRIEAITGERTPRDIVNLIQQIRIQSKREIIEQIKRSNNDLLSRISFDIRVIEEFNK